MDSQQNFAQIDRNLKSMNPRLNRNYFLVKVVPNPMSLRSIPSVEQKNGLELD